MNNEGTNKKLFYLLLLISFITVIWIDFSSNATFDSGDGVNHYLISRYSWKHPALFLDMWGKPIFTLLSSPFAQFGLKGMYVFQALCAALTSFFLFKIALVFKLNFAWSLPVFIFFSPIYFAVINTGLTEILFGCLLMFSIWLVIEKRFFAASILASFLLFVRPEGYLIIPLMASFFIIKRKWLALPLLLTSVVLYTIIGYLHYHNWFWIITNNYKFGDTVYFGMEKNFFHYFGKYNEIWGRVYSISLLTGIISIGYLLFRAIIRKKQDDFIWEKILLIAGSFTVIFFLHSISCSVPGFINNLGMVRYMTNLIPSSAIIALIGLNELTSLLKNKWRWLSNSLVILTLAFIVIGPFRQWYFPFRLNNEEAVIEKTTEWLKPKLLHNNICYLHPFIAVATNVDPYNSYKTAPWPGSNHDLIKQLPDNTYLVWDSHFSPLEGGTPLKSLLSDTNLNPICSFSYYNTAEPFDTWIFIKNNASHSKEPPFSAEWVVDSKQTENCFKGDSVFFNLNSINATEKPMLKAENNDSATLSLFYSTDKEYGPVFSRKLSDIGDYSHLRMINATFRIFPRDSVKDVKIVSEIVDNGKSKAWDGDNLPAGIFLNRWNTVHITQLYHPDALNNNCVLNFYFWNRGKSNFYVDSVRIGYYCLENNRNEPYLFLNFITLSSSFCIKKN